MNSKSILVTGGAGYIGNCTARFLKRRGFVPVGLDNYSTSSRDRELGFECREVDLTDRDATFTAIKKAGKVAAVFHFAAKALVPESVAMPETYFRNNLMSALNVAEAAVANGIPHFVHSSSCATYGIPESLPIAETFPMSPLSPYGESKFLVERMLSSISRTKPLKVLHLRYFNPAGALEDDGWVGEAHEPETHLIPNVVKAFLEKTAVHVFGNDYPTPDGTCQRDYIHIEDLAIAHLKAFEYLQSDKAPAHDAFNVGGGRGISVKEVIRTAEKALDGKIKVTESSRRSGDAPVLYADISRARSVLGWEPKRSLEEMIVSHFQYVRTRLQS